LGSLHRQPEYERFVSIDPEHDTPERIRSYLQHFGGHILGRHWERIRDERQMAEDSGAAAKNESSTDA
jgi:cytochrome oxidase Cu insertion factor (SCO1/SenC/PrrC family)